MTEPSEIAPSGPPRVELRLPSLLATARLGRALARVLGAGDLVLLEGSLGAGKTALVQFIVRGLGVTADQPVTSPTFEIVHEFRGYVPILHADLYRLAADEPLDELGIVARIGADAVVLIEWGERFAGQLGRTGIVINLELGTGSERRCALVARDARGRAVLDALIPLLSAARLAPL